MSGAEDPREQRRVTGPVEAGGGFGAGALAGAGPADQRVGGATARRRPGLKRRAVERVPGSAGVGNRIGELHHRRLVDRADRGRVAALTALAVADDLNRDQVAGRHRLQGGGHPVRLGGLLGGGHAVPVRIEDLEAAGLGLERVCVPDLEPVTEVGGLADRAGGARRDLLAPVGERLALGGDEAVVQVLVRGKVALQPAVQPCGRMLDVGAVVPVAVADLHPGYADRRVLTGEGDAVVRRAAELARHPDPVQEFVDRQASARVRLGEVPGHRNDHQLRVVELRDVSMEPLVFVGVVTGVRDRRQRPAVEDEHVEDCSGRVDVVADLDRSYHRAIQAHRLDRDERVRRHRVEPDPIRRRRSPGAVGEPHYVGAERGRAEPGGRAVGRGDLGGRRRALGRLERGRRRDDLPAELRGSGAHPLRLAVEPDVATDHDAPVLPRPDQRALAADEEADGRMPRRLAAATHPHREDVLATPKPIADRGRQGPHPVPGEGEVVADLDAVEAGVEHS